MSMLPYVPTNEDQFAAINRDITALAEAVGRIAIALHEIKAAQVELEWAVDDIIKDLGSNK